MKIAMISDVHTRWNDLVVPECDVLISAGDYSWRGEQYIVESFHQWLAKQPAKHIVSVQGNHELWVEHHFEEAAELVDAISDKIIFVEQDSFEIDGIKFFCSACTPYFGGWAWNVHRGRDIQKEWRSIPQDTEVLVTHGPAYGILDQIAPDDIHLGCRDLADRLANLEHLKLHVFGHIHGGSGEETINGVRFVNASICNEEYKAVNPVRVFDLEKSNG